MVHSPIGSSFKSALSDLRLLLWKNFIIQWRHPILSLFELLLPCLLVFILSLFRGSVNVGIYPNATIYEPFKLTKVELRSTTKLTLLYTPPITLNNEVVAEALVHLKKALHVEFTVMSFNDSTTMEHYYLTKHNDTQYGQVLCGIEFVELTQHNINFVLRFTSVPRHYASSTVRETWETIHIMPEVSAPGPRESKKNEGGKPGYGKEGFLLLQHELTLAAAKILQSEPPPNQNEKFSFEMIRFPFPPYVSDVFLFALSFLFPAVIVFSFIYSSVNLTKNLVIEKEKRLKESMKMMGLKEKYHWIAYFIKSAIWVIPSLAILVLLLCIKLKDSIAILNFSNPFVLFLFFFLYEISNVCLCFMISTFFSKANLAGIATGVIFFFTFIPFFTAVAQYSQISSFLKIVYCFLPNTNMAFGIYIIAMKESRGVGMDWANINVPAVPNDNLTLLLILGMKLVNSAIYLIVTWYVTQAFPGEYGVALPWYFPFTKEYWIGEGEQSFQVEHFANGHSAKANQNDNVEKNPVNLRAGIKIKNLSKTYDNGKTYSVTDLNLNIFNSQITALLGHNGAGKTTTISILTGLFKPTSGTALVNGYDIRTNMNSIRSSLGICPQFNVLFDELTVEEHLQFYCRLKRADMSSPEIAQEVTVIIDKLDLADKRKVQSSKLSGGMKRKLSVGIALIGGSKVVILDEPTSGMDVSARRFIWDLLLREKQYRSILISTHFMEEADILGDRIAIMSGGKLQCCGSPLFLKKRFGAGYHLTIAKKGADVDTDKITTAVKEYIENAQLESSVGVEVTYSLPDDDTEKFEPLLSMLESDNHLGITNYGISVTTMEEVFLKVGDYAKDKIDSITNSKENGYTENPVEQPVAKNYGLALLGQQLYALIVKKILYSMRSPFLTGAQLIIPFLVLNVTLLSLKAIPRLKEAPTLHMSLSQFPDPQVTYFFDRNAQNLADKYTDALQQRISNQNKIKGIESIDPQTIVTQIITTDLGAYNYNFMISAVLSGDGAGNYTLLGMFNNQAFHTPAIALKYLDETYIRHKYNQSNISITVTNHPLPLTTSENVKISLMNTQTQFQVMQGLIVGISFLVGSFAVLSVKERITKGKHLQKLSGVRVSVYWLSYLLTDYVIYLCSALLMVVTFVIYKEEGLYQEKQPWYLALGVVIHGFAILPCIYVLSFMFSAPATAYARLCLYVTVAGIAAILSDQITSIKDLELLDKNKILKPIFALFIPVYDLGKVASNLMENYDSNKVCHMDNLQEYCKLDSPPSLILPCCKDKCLDSCVAFEENFLSLNEPGIGRNLLFMVASSLLYFIILAVIESGLMNTLLNVKDLLTSKLIKNNKSSELIVENDYDVQLEKKRIESIDPQRTDIYKSNPLIVRNLVKKFGNFTAVNQISYTVQQGECFGMLGVNGAGKTTTFKMITGDENMTSGDIFVNGLDLRKDIHRAQQEMGYCPQFDSILDDLTGRETLTMYSRLRGIREDEIVGQIKELSHLLYFEMHVDKLVGQYSGGNKRKLSTAIALLGNPSISFLDEPTTGVDPVARRCLWEAIAKKLKRGCSVVLTSHSMEECEALCNRLIIMVNGQICCIGSPLQLKNKFGNGYTVLIRVSPYTEDTPDTDKEAPPPPPMDSLQRSATENKLKQNIGAVQQFMRDTFVGSSLKAVHNNMLHYAIEASSEAEVKCSQIFGAIERAKQKLRIEDYSVCQTNLEQIFLSFARKQRGEDSKDVKRESKQNQATRL